jgi:hypothetical protein
MSTNGVMETIAIETHAPFYEHHIILLCNMRILVTRPSLWANHYITIFL